ncbi:MAG: Spy/CpxP family protein refolding chaperone [Bacillota bacterium]
MRKYGLVVGLVVLLALFAGTALAAPIGDFLIAPRTTAPLDDNVGCPQGYGYRNLGLNGLGLTAEQADQIYEIQVNFINESAKIREEMALLAAEIRRDRIKGATTESLQSRIDQLNALREKMVALREEKLEAIRSILTPEQLQMLEEAAQNRYFKSRGPGKFGRKGCF